MKKPAYRAGLIALASVGMFAVLAPVIVYAQSEVFQLGELAINTERPDEPETPGEVLQAVTEEPSADTDEAQLANTEAAVVTIEVQRGDSLGKIAAAHATTWRRLFDANPSITDPDIINPGDVVRIPHPDEDVAARALPTPKPAVQPVTTQRQAARQPSTPAPAVADGSVWDALARCESGGRWNINTGNGYYGGLQFHPGTWRSNGGEKYAPYAHQATREQQIDIAQRLHAARGFKPWPACARKLGLL